MKNHGRILLFVAMTFITGFGLAQSNEISIEFMGNCGLYMTDGKTNIYIDFPYKSGAYNYMEFNEAELDSIKDNSIFIFTHKHADHYSRKNLKKVFNEEKGQKFGVWNIPELEKLGEALEDFDIKAFKTKHKVFGISFRHYSYLITWHGKRIYISGDTTNPETIGKIKNIDWAFIPYWLLINAKENKIDIDTEMIGIYHLYPAQIPSAKETWDDVDNIHPLTEQGGIITINY